MNFILAIFGITTGSFFQKALLQVCFKHLFMGPQLVAHKDEGPLDLVT